MIRLKVLYHYPYYHFHHNRTTQQDKAARNTMLTQNLVPQLPKSNGKGSLNRCLLILLVMSVIRKLSLRFTFAQKDDVPYCIYTLREANCLADSKRYPHFPIAFHLTSIILLPEPVLQYVRVMLSIISVSIHTYSDVKASKWIRLCGVRHWLLVVYN